jgi:hypothetical protein
VPCRQLLDTWQLLATRHPNQQVMQHPTGSRYCTATALVAGAAAAVQAKPLLTRGAKRMPVCNKWFRLAWCRLTSFAVPSIDSTPGQPNLIPTTARITVSAADPWCCCIATRMCVAGASAAMLTSQQLSQQGASCCSCPCNDISLEITPSLRSSFVTTLSVSCIYNRAAAASAATAAPVNPSSCMRLPDQEPAEFTAAQRQPALQRQLS